MSGRNSHLETAPAPGQESQGDAHIALRARQFCVGDPIPYVLTKDQLADVTGYSMRQIDRFRSTHSHSGIKQLEGPGHPRFCGRTLKVWLDGGAQSQPVARRFFGSARR